MKFEEILLNFLISLSANITFLVFVLYFLKPKVFISNYIANYEVQGVPRWAIKVVNKSYFSAYDVSPTLFIVKLIPANPSGYHKEYLGKVEFNRVTSYIGKRTIGEDKTGKHEYASWYITLVNLDELIIEDEKMVEFRISLKHGLSNFSAIQEKQYTLKSNIKKGKFVSGKKTDIV